MYKDFIENNHGCNVSHTRYYQELKAMNIGFVKFCDEENESCDLHNKHLIEVHGLADEADISRVKDTSPENKKYEKIFFPNCKECKDYEEHIKFANEGRKEYRKDRDRDWDDGETIYSADLQKVIMLAAMPGLKKENCNV